MKAEPCSPGDIIALGGGHDNEPGTPGGPVRVVIVIELVSVSFLLQYFTNSAVGMILRRIEEN